MNFFNALRPNTKFHYLIELATGSNEMPSMMEKTLYHYNPSRVLSSVFNKEVVFLRRRLWKKVNMTKNMLNRQVL